MPRLSGSRTALELGRVIVGTPTVTTTSTAGEDFPGVTLTVACRGKLMVVEFGCGSVSHSVAGGITQLALYVDGAYQDAVDAVSGAANAKASISGRTLLTPSVGSHTFKLQRKIFTAGTGTFFTQFYPLHLRVSEALT